HSRGVFRLPHSSRCRRTEQGRIAAGFGNRRQAAPGSPPTRAATRGKSMSNSLLRPAIVLGTLALIGPFAIDMYLPAMPAIAADLGVDETAAQGTITAYFIAFGLAQMIYGPWADQSGRK